MRRGGAFVMSNGATSPRTAWCAALIPVGPAPIDLWRAVELVKSVSRWEPLVNCCVFLDDGTDDRGLSELQILPPYCQTVTLKNLRQGTSHHWLGGLCSSTFAGLSWIQAHVDVQFVIKLDTDALVIAPFASTINAFLDRVPDAGVIGVVGLSCNPDRRSRQNVTAVSKIVTAYHTWPRLSPEETSNDALTIPGFARPVTIEARRCFDALRPHIEAAMANGYLSPVYCQGGSFAVSRSMLDRMASAGYFDEPQLWLPLCSTEDLTTAMYARAVNMGIYDYSSHGEPFGIQYRGLPYSPQELVSRGHAIVHSVKNDPHYSEGFIRHYFSR